MTAADIPDVDHQIGALIEMIGTLADVVSRLSGRVDQLSAEVRSQRTADGDAPAPWVFMAPAHAPDGDPAVVAEKFVAYYNRSCVGTDGGRARGISDCWREHPGLVAEIGCLAFSWREANIGATANVRDAQHWLHQWRPGFVDRMVRGWLRADCLDGDHQWWWAGNLGGREGRATSS